MDMVVGPEIYIVGRQKLDTQAVEDFLNDEDVEWWHAEEDASIADSLKIAELGGRLCYKSFSDAQYRRPNAQYIANIIKQEHNSVLEHAVWTFIITGISRSLSHELVRHRIASFSQLSQRYVSEDDTRFVLPPAYMDQPILIEYWMDSMRRQLADYVALVERHTVMLQELQPDMPRRDLRIAARQAARSVLPNATETMIQVTMNARSIRHFLAMRGSIYAEPEIRRLAVELAEEMKVEAPAFFADVSIVELSDGALSVEVANREV